MLPGGRTFTAVDAPVKHLIMTAYEVTDAQLLGGPDWIDSTGFDINRADRDVFIPRANAHDAPDAAFRPIPTEAPPRVENPAG